MNHDVARAARHGSDRSHTVPIPDGLRDGVFSLQQEIGNEAVNALIGRPMPEVRIHNDASADARARTHHAAAVTEGADIHFSWGLLGADEEFAGLVLAHELAHVVQQTVPRRQHGLSPEQAEREASGGPGTTITAGGVSPGTVQAFRWPWEDKPKSSDPDLEATRFVRARLKNDPDSWRELRTYPQFSEIVAGDPELARTLGRDPDYWRWAKDPTFMPSPSEGAQIAQGEAARQAKARAREHPSQPATDASVGSGGWFDEAGNPVAGPVTIRPSETFMTVAGPPPAATVRPGLPRRDPKAEFLETWASRTTLQQQAEAARGRPLPMFYSDYERRLDEPSVMELLPGVRLGRLLGEFAAGEKVSGYPVSRSQKAKEIAIEAALQAGGLLIPESEAASPEAAEETLTMTPLEKNIAERGLPIGPEAPPIQDVFQPTSTPGPGMTPEAYQNMMERGIKVEKGWAREAFQGGVRKNVAPQLNVGAGDVVHHGVELQVLDRYPGAFTESELNSLANMRGIPQAENAELHLSLIRKVWDSTYTDLDQILAREGLTPGMPEYNVRVRDFLTRRRDQVDFIVGHIYTGSGAQ